MRGCPHPQSLRVGFVGVALVDDIAPAQQGTAVRDGLGKTGGIATTRVAASPAYMVRRDERMRLRAVLWQDSTHRGMRSCGIVRIVKGGAAPDAPSGVTLRRTSGGIPYMTGTQTCGKLDCPVCGPKIWAERGTTVDEILRKALEQGCGIYSGLCTVPHVRAHSLLSTRTLLRDSFRALWTGGAATRLKKRFGVIGLIRVWDGTFGRNGWHPHIHYLLVTERPLSPEEASDLQRVLFERWAYEVTSRGRDNPRESLCQLNPVLDGSEPTRTARYLTKAATFELTRHDLKSAKDGHLSPFEILDLYERYGDEDLLSLWHEWERGMHTVRRYFCSPTLKKRFDIVERTDEDIAADETLDEDDGSGVELTNEQWRRLQSNRDKYGYILSVCATHGPAQAARLIDELPLREERDTGPSPPG